MRGNLACINHFSNSHFWTEMAKHLSTDIVNQIRLTGKIFIWDGDITQPNLGLCHEQLRTFKTEVNILIHAASTIQLTKKLSFMRDQIIEPSLAIMEFALQSKSLTRFVYVSTAYASAFLRFNGDDCPTGSDALITEDIHPISDKSSASLDNELAQVRRTGNSVEFNYVRHMSSYTYAKHLTERLLFRGFAESGKPEALLIFRPSMVGPAEKLPFPFYERSGSAPFTAIAAGYLLCPPRTIRVPSYLQDIGMAEGNEIPVDMVVNRLIMHTAVGTTGCVHAVAGRDTIVNIATAGEAFVRRRRWWWGRPFVTICNYDWHDCRLWFVARVFAALGCAFQFDDAKTKALWEQMSEADKEAWPLWATGSSSFLAMEDRMKNVRLFMTNCLSIPRAVQKFFIW